MRFSYTPTTSAFDSMDNICHAFIRLALNQYMHMVWFNGKFLYTPTIYLASLIKESF